MEYFHYLDDIILLAVDLALLRVLTQALCNFLEAKGLVVSPKSCTEPCQAACWIGKKFDLKHMCIENLPSTTLKSVAGNQSGVTTTLPKTHRKDYRSTTMVLWPQTGGYFFPLWLAQN